MSDEERCIDALRKCLHQRQELVGAGKIKLGLETHLGAERELLLDSVDGFPDARGSACEHEVEAHPAMLHLAPDAPRRLPSAIVERAVEVIEARNVPVRLRVPKDRKALQLTSSIETAASARSLSSTRAIA